MFISQNLISIGHRMVQEDGSQPGEPLSFIKAIIYFGVIPVGIFMGIAGLVMLFTTERKKGSQLTSID